MPGNQDIIIRSQDRKNGTTSSFIVNLTNCLNPGDFMEVTDIAIPNLWYNIDSYNNTIVFNDGSLRTATVTTGYYSNFSLLTALAAAMQVASGVTTFTAAQNSSTLLTTITGSNTFTINFALSTIAYVLGFPTTGSSSSSLTQTSTQAMVLNPLYLLLRITEIDSGRVYDTNFVSGTLKIPILSSNQQVNYLTTEQLSNQRLQFSNKTASLTIELLKADRNPLTLMADWSFTVRVC